MYVIVYRRIGTNWKVSSTKEVATMDEAQKLAAKRRAKAPPGACKTVIRNHEPKIPWTELVGA